MLFEEILRQEVCAAWMAGSGYETHAGRHLAVGGFSLHCAARVVSVPGPLFYASGRGINVATEGTLVRLLFLVEAVEVVGQELLGQFHVDLPFLLLH